MDQAAHKPSAQHGQPAPRLIPELLIYYVLVGLYFFAFGMQFVLFPSLVAFYLQATPAGVGLAQSAISAPMFCFLLFGGLLAERAKAGPTLTTLQLVFTAATIGLYLLVQAGWLTYSLLIAYAMLVGMCAALLMPVRDAALNGVIEREAERGRHTPIATAAAMTTAVQIGAQIAGIVVAARGGADPAPYLALQAGVLSRRRDRGPGADRAQTHRARAQRRRRAARCVREGLSYAFRSPVMSPMLISAAFVGVFRSAPSRCCFRSSSATLMAGRECRRAGWRRCSPASGAPRSSRR